MKVLRDEPRLAREHEKWVDVLGLGQWEDGSFMFLEEGDGTWAEVENCQWEYRRFRIRYYDRTIALTDDRLRWTVVHELTHIVAAPVRDLMFELIDTLDDGDDTDAKEKLKDQYERLDERITSEITCALIRAFEAGKKEALDSVVRQQLPLSSAQPCG